MSRANASKAAPEPALGLRERKKIKTRLAIQGHALRLIREQGYGATTVEQIAAAAEISPSTFFRYFPTKDAVILTDDYDPLMIDAFRRQPPDVGTVRALRRAYQETFVNLTEDEARNFYERSAIIMEVPELRASFMDMLVDGTDLMSSMIAQRTGRRTDDPDLRALVGALIGIAVTEFVHWSRHPDADFGAAVDAAMERLEPAFPW